MRALLVVFYLFIVSISFGLPASVVIGKNDRERMLVALPLGFFLQISCFHALCFPAIYLHIKFSRFVLLYNIIIIAIGLASAFYGVQKKPIKLHMMRLRASEILCLVVLIAVLGLQIVNAIRYDTTYMSYDDAGYVTYAADAIARNEMMVTDPSTGIACAVIKQRAAQTSLMYPALLSYISGISLSTINRTVLEVFYIVLAYSVYAYIACILFRSRENALIFLIILAVLYVWGYYSHYSVTFRLLGPNYQGKAILAVSMLPLVYSICLRAINRPYRTSTGIIMLLLSMASVAFSLFGAAMIILNTVIIILLSMLRRDRKCSCFGYLPWTCIIPVFHIAMYFV